MARATFVKKARKPNRVVSQEDIDRANAGEDGAASYYWWKFRRGGKHFSRKRPRPSQLTQSRWGEVLGAEEGYHDQIDAAESMEDLRSAVEDAQSMLEDFAGECEEAADAVEENFPGSEQAEQIRERGTNCEEFKDGELDQFELEDERIQCDDCEGAGKDDDGDECENCDGSGNDPDTTLDNVKDELREACWPDDPY